MRFKQIPTCLKSKEQTALSIATYCVLLLFVFNRCAFAQESSGSGDVLLWDGLENDTNWSVNVGGNLALTPDHKTEGNTSMEVNVNGQVPAQGVILKKAGANLDISFANKVMLDIYNSGPPCQIALAFDTGNYHESVPKTLNSGMNKNVTFEISPKDFKTPFDYASTAKNVMLVIYPGGEPVGPVYLDNIRIKKYGGLKSAPPGISPAAVAEGYTPPEVTPENTVPDNILYGAVLNNPPISTVSEHKTFLLFGAGLLGLFFYRKKS